MSLYDVIIHKNGMLLLYHVLLSRNEKMRMI